MMPFLAWEMEDRGDDSWGATDGVEVIKRVGAVTGSWELPEHWEGCICHTRAASVGDVSEENAHPFVFPFMGDNPEDGTGRKEIGKVIGVHNGHVSNYAELNTKYGRKFEVDSMHIFAHIGERLPMTEVSGWGAVVWYQPPERSLCLVKFNMMDLQVVRMGSGEVVFASTLRPIMKAAAMARGEVKTIYKWPGEVLCYIDRKEGKDVLVEGEKMAFGKALGGGKVFSRGTSWGMDWVQEGTTGVSQAPQAFTPVAGNYAPWDSKAGSYEDLYKDGNVNLVGLESRRAKVCIRCKTVACDRKRHLVCEECLGVVRARTGYGSKVG